ncbi:hypothetical protein [Streptomyces sp. S4.7]|uniref:hypothetical protein n=1 Tax=Streptomyces sp. S4.7 TaxID=2705439 RepID=UPI0013DB1C5B|nr:hypothetical protein [Streptomyces sp. S4.7]
MATTGFAVLAAPVVAAVVEALLRISEYQDSEIRRMAPGDFPRCEGSKHACLSSSHSKAERTDRTVELQRAEVPGRPWLGGIFFT